MSIELTCDNLDHITRKKNLLECYRSLNFTCIPVNGKRAIQDNWQNTSFEHSIYNNFSGRNVGIITGRTFFILDVDIAKNEREECGMRFLSDILQRNGLHDIPTVSSLSGSGGRHYYFKLHENFKSSRTKGVTHPNGKKVTWDIKAHNSYIVAPPSIHPDTGNEYVWINSPLDYEIIDIPIYISEAFSIKPTTSQLEIELLNSGLPKRIKRNKIYDSSDVELSHIERLLGCLALQRTDDYDDWIMVGMALYHRDEEYFDIWNQWSKQSNKYKNDTEAFNKWKSFGNKIVPQATVNKPLGRRRVVVTNKDEEKEKLITIGTLLWMANQDDPVAYREILNDIRRKPFIDMDTIKSNETADTANIGSYKERLKKGGMVAIKSNAKTYKTQNIKELLESNDKESYKKVLFITFRISLALEYYRKFEKYKLLLYSHFKNSKTIREDRIIFQIDSLRKIRGDYNLLILDEIEYIINHYFNFVRDLQVYNTLIQQISIADKVIICDAFLSQDTINWFNECFPLKGLHVVENLHKSFKGKKVTINYDTSQSFIYTVTCCLENGENVVSPVSSKYAAEREYDNAISTNKYKVCLISSDGVKRNDRIEWDGNGEIPIEYLTYIKEDIPTDDWGKYNLLITTPKIAAGISFELLHFNRRVCYFTNRSCFAGMCVQMFFRVRDTKPYNTLSDTVDLNKINIPELFSDTKPLNGVILDDIIVINEVHYSIEGYPLRDDDLDKHVIDRIDTYKGLNIEIDTVSNEIIQTPYYRLFRYDLKRQNMSKHHLGRVIENHLTSHGVELTVNRNKMTDEEILTKCDNEILDIIQERRSKSQNKLIAEAEEITPSEYNYLKSLEDLTSNESNSVSKFKIRAVYNICEDNVITEELVADLGSKEARCIFKNIPYLKGNLQDGLNFVIADMKKKAKTKGYDVLTDGRRYLELIFVLKCLIAMGYSRLNETRVSNTCNNLLLEFMRDNETEYTSTYNKPEPLSLDSGNMRGIYKILKGLLERVGLTYVSCGRNRYNRRIELLHKILYIKHDIVII